MNVLWGICLPRANFRFLLVVAVINDAVDGQDYTPVIMNKCCAVLVEGRYRRMTGLLGGKPIPVPNPVLSC
jgi:hypothetical protein